MSVAFLCPGQGAHSAGFLHRLPSDPIVSATLKAAGEILGLDVLTLDSAESLRSTIAIQLSTVIASVATGRMLLNQGVEIEACAGLSVGAFSAAILCGAVTFEELLPIVKLRATLMENAYPTGYGLAVINGLALREVERLIALVQPTLYLANLNSPTQFVVAGRDVGLSELIELAKTAGARKAELLAVGVPSHCTLLDKVGEELEGALRRVSFRDPQISYVSNRGARLCTTATAVREDLALNVTAPVLWHDSTTLLHELGTRLFVELSPGNALTKLATAAFTDSRALSVDETRPGTILALATRAASAD